MFPIQDQLSVVIRTNLESQIALFTLLTHKSFESMEKVWGLNFNAMKASMEESSNTAKQLLSTKSPQEFFSVSSAQTQPTMEKALAYSRHFANIASTAQAEFTKAAETQMTQTHRKITQLVNDAASVAPAGSEDVAVILKSALESATNNYERFMRTTKQAMEAVEANFHHATNRFSTAK